MRKRGKRKDTRKTIVHQASGTGKNAKHTLHRSCNLQLTCSDLVFSFVMTKGILAMDISWSNTPKAHQSADFPYENPAKISGAMYSFVPHSV